MLPIEIPGGEFWDEAKEEFVYSKGAKLKLEHSLISISDWEKKWHDSYFDTQKTDEQAIDYIRCMVITKDFDPGVLKFLSQKNVNDIYKYMSDPMTATTIGNLMEKEPTKSRYKKVTSELIYYWMIQFGIPFTCEKWHINRLIMLIQVCSEENKPSKKEDPKALAAKYRAINAARRAKYNTKG